MKPQKYENKLPYYHRNTPWAEQRDIKYERQCFGFALLCIALAIVAVVILTNLGS